MGSSRKRIFLSGYGPIRSQVLTHFEFVFSTCYERRRCFLKAACAMDAPQGRATKRTSRRFSRSLISANGRGDATILQPRARRLLHNTADLKGRHEMDMRVKGRPSRPSPTRLGKAALLYGQWGGGADNGEDDNDNGSRHGAGLRRMIRCQCGAVPIACTSLDVPIAPGEVRMSR